MTSIHRAYKYTLRILLTQEIASLDKQVMLLEQMSSLKYCFSELKHIFSCVLPAYLVKVFGC